MITFPRGPRFAFGAGAVSAAGWISTLIGSDIDHSPRDLLWDNGHSPYSVKSSEICHV
jgi:hypothetical protein